jgi:hypothetical protein
MDQATLPGLATAGDRQRSALDYRGAAKGAFGASLHEAESGAAPLPRSASRRRPPDDRSDSRKAAGIAPRKPVTGTVATADGAHANGTQRAEPKNPATERNGAATGTAHTHEYDSPPPTGEASLHGARSRRSIDGGVATDNHGHQAPAKSAGSPGGQGVVHTADQLADPASTTQPNDVEIDPDPYLQADHYVDRPETHLTFDRYNGGSSGYTSWQEFVWDADLSVEWLAATSKHGFQQKSVMLLKAANKEILAVGDPIQHDSYGVGWEFTPRFVPGVSRTYDTVPHRVYFKEVWEGGLWASSHHVMRVFKQDAAGNWSDLGDKVPGYVARNIDLYDIESGDFSSKGAALVQSLADLRDDLSIVPPESEENPASKFKIGVADFSRYPTEYRNSLYVYDRGADKLQINARAIATTKTGLSTTIGGKTGQAWNAEILRSGLELARRVKQGSFSLAGDITRGDQLYGRPAGDDWANRPLAEKTESQTKAVKAAFVYGHTAELGFQYYGDFTQPIRKWLGGALGPQQFQRVFDYLAPADVKGIADTLERKGRHLPSAEDNAVVLLGTAANTSADFQDIAMSSKQEDDVHGFPLNGEVRVGLGGVDKVDSQIGR